MFSLKFHSMVPLEYEENVLTSFILNIYVDFISSLTLFFSDKLEIKMYRVSEFMCFRVEMSEYL